MKKTNKILLGIIVLAIIITACTQKPSEEQTSKDELSKQQSEEKTVPSTKKLVDKDIEVSVMLGESNLVPLSNDMLHYKWMYERTGIKISFLPIPSADYKQKKQTLLATGDLPEIIQVDQLDINNYSETGIFLELSQYKEQLPNFYEKVEKYPDAKFTFIDGKPFGFPTLNRWDLTRGSSLVVRKDIREELSIEIPKTFDEYYEMLKKFKASHPECIPYVNRNGSGNLMLTLGYSLGSGNTIMFDPQAGKFLFQPAKQETKQVLAYLNNMYKEKLLDPDYASVKGTAWEEKIASGIGLSFLDNVGYAAKYIPKLQEINNNVEFEVIFLPKNSFGYARGLYTAPHQLNRIWAINPKTEKIDAIIKMFNWLYTDEACDLLNLGREGIDFIREPNGEIKFTPEVIKKYSDDKGNFIKTSMHKERGNAAYECFIPYSDLHSYFLETPEIQMNWYKEIIQKDQAFTYPVPTPPFTKEERERVVNILPELEMVATEMFDKLILGIEPIETFDEYLKKFKSKGLDEIEKIYNDAYNRVK